MVVAWWWHGDPWPGCSHCLQQQLTFFTGLAALWQPWRGLVIFVWTRVTSHYQHPSHHNLAHGSSLACRWSRICWIWTGRKVETCKKSEFWSAAGPRWRYVVSGLVRNIVCISSLTIHHTPYFQILDDYLSQVMTLLNKGCNFLSKMIMHHRLR